MEFSTIKFKGFEIKKRIDIKSHSCIIYKDDSIFKCICGDILKDGSENSVKKAKEYINNL